MVFVPLVSLCVTSALSFSINRIVVKILLLLIKCVDEKHLKISFQLFEFLEKTKEQESMFSKSKHRQQVPASECDL